LSGTTQPVEFQTQNKTHAPIDAASATLELLAGPLGNAAVLATNNHAGAQTYYTFSFVPTNDFPSNGKLVATFPTGVGLGGVVSSTTSSGCGSGTFAASASSQILTLTRTADVPCAAGSTITITVGQIRNPPTAGTLQVGLQTKTAAGAEIDSGSAPLTTTAGQLPGLQITPNTNLAGADATYNFQFTTANPWPRNGRLVVSFPADFTLGNVVASTVPATTAASCDSSSLSPTRPSATSIAFNRTASADCNGAITIELTHIRNPGFARAVNEISITTQTLFPGADIDAGTATIPILASNLALSVTPGSTDPGAATTYSLGFTNNNPWPADGRLRIEFPPGFDVSQASGAATQGCTAGSFAVSRTGSTTLIIDRSQSTVDCSGSATYVLSQVKNAPTAGPAGTLIVKTQSKNGVKELSAGSQPLALTAGALTLTDLAPASMPVHSSGPLEFAFRLAHEWKSTGSFSVAFPPGFDLTSLSPSATVTGCAGGSFSTTKSGGIVTVTRTNGVPCAADTTIHLTLSGIQTPTATATYAGASAIPIRTTTPDGADLDIGSVAFTVTPGAISASRSTITAAPTTLVADGTSTSALTILLRDSYGNRVLQSGGTGVITATRGAMSTVTDHLDGSYAALLTASQQQGTATITGRVGSLTLDAPAMVTFTPGAASGATSTISAADSQIIADGSAHTLITVALKDAYGNGLSSGGAALALETTAGSLSAVVDRGDGTYTSVLTSSTQAGTSMISGSIGTAVIAQKRSVDFIAGPATQMNAIGATTVNGIAAGSVQLLRVKVADDFGNPVAGLSIDWFVTSGAGTLDHASSLSGTDGIASATITTNQARQTNSVRAQDPPAAPSLVGGPISFVINTVSGAPATLARQGPNPILNVVAGSTQELRAIAQDAYGNPVSGIQVGWAITRGAGSLSAPSSVTNADGIALTTLTTDTTAGLNNVSATSPSIAATPTPFTVKTGPGPFSLLRSTIGASPRRIVADGVSMTTITLLLRDANGNPLSSSAGAVAFDATRGTLSGALDAGDGSYGVLLKSLAQAGPSVVSAAIGGQTFPHTAAVDFIPGAPKQAAAVGATTIAGIPAGTVQNLQVRVTDANGNVVAGVRLQWSTTGGARLAAVSSLSDADGVASNALTTANASGLNEAWASNATLAGGPVAFRVTTIVGQASQLAVVGPAVLRSVKAGATQGLAVKASDGHGNGVRDVNVSWVIQSGSGTLTSAWALTDTAGLARTTLKTTKTPGSIVVAAVNSALSGSPVGVTITTVPSYAAASSGTLPTNLAAGNATTVQVQVLDQNGALAPGVRINWSVSAGGGSVSPAFSLTGTDGLAQTELTTGPKVANNTVVATNSSLGGTPLNLSLRTVPGAPAALRFGTTATASTRGTPFTTSVELIDARGNMVPRTGTVQLSIGSGPSGQLNGTLSRPWALGAAQFSDLRFGAAGAYRLLATYQGFQNTSREIVVSAPAVTPPPKNRVDTGNATAVDASAMPFFVPDVEAVRQKNGSVLVNWTPPAGELIGGFLIWRAASPFVMLAQVDAATSTFVDANATRGHTYRYTVTFFRQTGDGFLQTKNAITGLPAKADMPTSATITESGQAKTVFGVEVNTAWVLPLASGTLGLCVAGVVVAWGLRRRGRTNFLVVPHAAGSLSVIGAVPPSIATPLVTEEADGPAPWVAEAAVAGPDPIEPQDPSPAPRRKKPVKKPSARAGLRAPSRRPVAPPKARPARAKPRGRARPR
jgi:adhesin/invasin